MMPIWIWAIWIASAAAGQLYEEPEIITAPNVYGERIEQYLPPLEYQQQLQQPKSQQNFFLSNFEKQTIAPIYVEESTPEPPVLPFYTQSPLKYHEIVRQPAKMVVEDPPYQSQEQPAAAMRRSDSYENQVQNSHAYIQPQNLKILENQQKYVQREYKAIRRQNNFDNNNNDNYEQFNQTAFSYYQPDYTTMKPTYDINNFQQDKPFVPPQRVQNVQIINQDNNNQNNNYKQESYSSDFANQVYDSMKKNQQAQPRNNFGNAVYGDRIIPDPPAFAMSRSSAAQMPANSASDNNGNNNNNINNNNINGKEQQTAESILKPSKYVPGVPSQFKMPQAQALKQLQPQQQQLPQKQQLLMDIGTQQYAQQYPRTYNHPNQYQQQYQQQFQQYQQQLQQQPRTTTEPMPVLKQMVEMEADGSFQYETLTGDQTHIIQQGHIENRGTDQEEQIMQGSYSFVGDDGRVYTVTYIADANGFRATGDHLPTAPPMPEAIQRAVEYNLAEEAAAEAFKRSEPYAQFSNNQLVYANQQNKDNKNSFSPVPNNNFNQQAKERSSMGYFNNNDYNNNNNNQYANQPQAKSRSSIEYPQYNEFGNQNQQPMNDQFGNNQIYSNQQQQGIKRSSQEYSESFNNNQNQMVNQDQQQPMKDQYNNQIPYSNEKSSQKMNNGNQVMNQNQQQPINDQYANQIPYSNQQQVNEKSSQEIGNENQMMNQNQYGNQIPYSNQQVNERSSQEIVNGNQMMNQNQYNNQIPYSNQQQATERSSQEYPQMFNNNQPINNQYQINSNQQQVMERSSREYPETYTSNPGMIVNQNQFGTVNNMKNQFDNKMSYSNQQQSTEMSSQELQQIVPDQRHQSNESNDESLYSEHQFVEINKIPKPKQNQYQFNQINPVTPAYQPEQQQQLTTASSFNQ